VEFERLLKDYPESDSAGSASFRLGEAYFGQSRKPDFRSGVTRSRHSISGRAIWPRIRTTGWSEARRARSSRGRDRLAKKLVATGNLYLKLKYPDPARIYFQRVVDEYRRHADETHHALLGLAREESRFPNPDKAIALYKQIESEYPKSAVANDAARERKRLEHRKKR
jgi:TolA-binding protein